MRKKRIFSVLLCALLLFTLLPHTVTAEAAALSSLTVNGRAVNIKSGDPSGWNEQTGSGWKYDVALPGAEHAISQLTLVNCAAAGEIRGAGDLTIAAAGTNRISRLNVNGNVTLVGSGLLIVDEVTHPERMSVGGVALFVRDGAGRYVLQSDGELLERVVLPAGDYVIPGNTNLNLALYMTPTGEEFLEIGDLTVRDSISSGQLLIPAGASLTVEAGGSISLEQLVLSHFTYVAQLTVEGALTLRSGSSIQNDGRIEVRGGGELICLGTGGITGGSIDLSPGSDPAGTKLNAVLYGAGVSNVTLRADMGHFIGGIRFSEPTPLGSWNISVLDMQDGRRAALDWLELDGAGVMVRLSSYFGYYTTTLPMGVLEVRERIFGTGELEQSSVNLQVGAGGINLGSMYIYSGCLSVAGPLSFSSEFSAQDAALNLAHAPVVAGSVPDYSYVRIVSPSDAGVDGSSVYSPPDAPAELGRQYLHYVRYAARFSVSPVENRFLEAVPYSWSGRRADLTYARLMEADPLLGEPYTVEIVSLQDGILREVDLSVLYFDLFGADANGNLRVWRVLEGSRAPALTVLYAVNAIYHFDRSATEGEASGSEDTATSSHTGSGVLGGKSSVALCAVGVHSFGSATLVKAPTCMAAGKQTSACANCGKTQTLSAPALGHNYSGKTCIRCGRDNPDYKEPVVSPEDEASPSSLPSVPAAVVPPPVRLTEEISAGVSNGAAQAALSGEALTALLAKLGAANGRIRDIDITVSGSEGCRSLTVQFPSEFIAAAAASGSAITVKMGGFALRLEALDIAAAYPNALTIMADTAGALTDAQRDAVNGRPYMSITLRYGDAGQSSLTQNALLSLAYTPQAGEILSGILLRHIAPDGSSENLTSWYENGFVHAYLPHFSVFYIAYDAELAWRNPFSDVAQSDWFYHAVRFVSNEGLFVGTTDSRFSPDVSMTRAMFATVLHRLAGKPSVPADAPAFSDVAADAWYADAVLWAVSAGVSQGDGTGLFGPDEKITREQMVVMLYRYVLGKAPGTIGYDAALERFSDRGGISPWAEDAFRWAVSAGVVKGNADGTLDARARSLRSHVAQLFYNYLGG